MLASCTMMATVLPTPSVKCVPLSGAGLSPDSSQEWPRFKPQETSFHIFNKTWFKVFSTKTKEGHLCLHQNKLSSEKQPACDRGCGSPHFFAQEQPLASRVTLRGRGKLSLIAHLLQVWPRRRSTCGLEVSCPHRASSHNLAFLEI